MIGTTQLIGAGLGIAKGLIGSGARKREQRAAQANLDKRMDQYESQDTSNVYDNMENTMEDLTVNTQAADFAAQQSNQGLSNTMAGMNAAAGGSGIAALAQAMAGQQSTNMQQASIGIGQQEQANQQAERAQAGKLQLYKAKGELISRDAKSDIIETQAAMANDRMSTANKAVNQANESLMGGVSGVLGAGAEVVAGMESLGGVKGAFGQSLGAYLRK